MAAVSMLGLWLLLSAGGAVAGAAVAVCSIFGKAIGGMQRIDLFGYG